jgi:hypothetical protein
VDRHTRRVLVSILFSILLGVEILIIYRLAFFLSFLSSLSKIYSSFELLRSLLKP